MTVSLTVCSVELLGAPNRALSLASGRVTLRDSAAPHVTADITVARPTLATLTALDPRQARRVRITVYDPTPAGAVTRVFDLGLRRRRFDHGGASMALGLESDEALLTDYAPGEDDTGAFTYQDSLRGVVNYVLSKIGAALAASPSGDANIRTYSSATNLAANPRASANVTSWGATAASGVPTITRLTGDASYQTGIQTVWANAQGSQVRVEHVGIPVSPGRRYVMAMSARASWTGDGAYIGVSLFNAAGIQVGGSQPQPIPIGASYERRYVAFDVPTDATQAVARLYLPSTPANATLIVSGLMFREPSADPTDDPTAYWDGDAPDTSTYTYDWSNTAGASSTRRTALIERSPESLLWRAGVDGYTFLLSLVQAAGYRLVCDESRVWTLRGEGYSAPGNLTVRAGVNLADATDTIERDARFWFDAQATRYEWVANGITYRRTDYYAQTEPPTLVNYVEIRAPYPGPGRSQYAVRRAQGKGREVTVNVAADWTTRAEQASSFVLEGAPVQLGRISTIDFDLITNRMTVSGRTADAGAGSINLKTGTINALPGKINNL